MAVLWHDELDSTNAEVLRRADSLDNLSVIAARFQTAGRGQRGNSWSAAPGENLTFSILLRHPGSFPAPALIRVNWLAALSVREFLRSRNIDAIIKWPNDIYAGRKKICGILVENRFSTESVSVIGIGININQTVFPADLPNPTSMKRVTGHSYAPSSELDAFLSVFNDLYPLLYSRSDDLSGDLLYCLYSQDLFQAGLPCPYRDLRSGELFDGIICGVSPDGRLRVERTAGDGLQEVTSPALYGFKDIGYIL